MPKPHGIVDMTTLIMNLRFWEKKGEIAYFKGDKPYGPHVKVVDTDGDEYSINTIQLDPENTQRDYIEIVIERKD